MAFCVSARLPATSTKLSETGDVGIVSVWPKARRLSAIEPARPPTTARRVGLNVICYSSLICGRDLACFDMRRGVALSPDEKPCGPNVHCEFRFPVLALRLAFVSWHSTLIPLAARGTRTII